MKEYIVEIVEDSECIRIHGIKTELIRCKDCRYWSSEDGQTGYCNGFNLVYRKYDADYYCATAEPIEHDD